MALPLPSELEMHVFAIGCPTAETCRSKARTVLEEQMDFTRVSVTHGGKINAFGHA
jgi:hypothetical protein